MSVESRSDFKGVETEIKDPNFFVGLDKELALVVLDGGEASPPVLTKTLDKVQDGYGMIDGGRFEGQEDS